MSQADGRQLRTGIISRIVTDGLDDDVSVHRAANPRLRGKDASPRDAQKAEWVSINKFARNAAPIEIAGERARDKVARETAEENDRLLGIDETRTVSLKELNSAVSHMKAHHLNAVLDAARPEPFIEKLASNAIRDALIYGIGVTKHYKDNP